MEVGPVGCGAGGGLVRGGLGRRAYGRGMYSACTCGCQERWKIETSGGARLRSPIVGAHGITCPPMHVGDCSVCKAKQTYHKCGVERSGVSIFLSEGFAQVHLMVEGLPLDIR
jgi:hypothetical protein